MSPVQPAPATCPHHWHPETPEITTERGNAPSCEGNEWAQLCRNTKKLQWTSGRGCNWGSFWVRDLQGFSSSASNTPWRNEVGSGRGTWGRSSATSQKAVKKGGGRCEGTERQLCVNRAWTDTPNPRIYAVICSGWGKREFSPQWNKYPKGTSCGFALKTSFLFICQNK